MVSPGAAAVPVFAVVAPAIPHTNSGLLNARTCSCFQLAVR